VFHIVSAPQKVEHRVFLGGHEDFHDGSLSATTLGVWPRSARSSP
jgi:hypothetical protein